MRSKIVLIVAVFILFLSGCVQNLPKCEFQRQIGEYSTATMGEIPSMYDRENYKLFVLGYIGPNSRSVLINIKVFENEGEAQEEFKNTNYYSSNDCRVIDGKSDCLVPSGKSTNDRACNSLGVAGRCVSILGPTDEWSWIVEFEWLEGKEIKGVKLTSAEQLEREEKFKLLELFVNNLKNCAVNN